MQKRYQDCELLLSDGAGHLPAIDVLLWFRMSGSGPGRPRAIAAWGGTLKLGPSSEPRVKAFDEYGLILPAGERYRIEIASRPIRVNGYGRPHFLAVPFVGIGEGPVLT
jgi:hypothetical protein